MQNNINVALIESYIGENFLSYTAFCKRCGISMATFRKIVNGSDFRINALIKIARTVGAELKDLIVAE